MLLESVAGDCQRVGVFGKQRRGFHVTRHRRLVDRGPTSHLEADLLVAVVRAEQLDGIRETLLDALYYLRRQTWSK